MRLWANWCQAIVEQRPGHCIHLSSYRGACYFPLIIMRRFVAILVLSVIAWGTLAPFVMATTASATPLCCRRDGKHHCQMEMQSAESHATQEPNLRATAPKCPYRNLLPVPTATSLPHFAQPLGRTVPVVSYVFFKTIPSSLPFSISSLSQRGPPRSSI